MDVDVEVLVVGAGPAGLALAAELGRRAVPFRVVDRKVRPEKHSKALNLWPRTQEALAATGALEAIAADAVRARTFTLHAYGSFLGEVRFLDAPSPYAGPLALFQGHVEQVLADLARERGSAVEYATTVTAVRPSPAAVEVDLERGGVAETVRCRYLVGCDGGDSLVRRAVGLDYEASSPGDHVVMHQVDVRLEWNRPTDPRTWWMWLHAGGGNCGVVPLPGGVTRVFTTYDDPAKPLRDPTLQEMQDELRAASGDPTATLSDPSWYGHGRLRHGIAPAFRRGRVLLAGDAAHRTLPVGAQGMNSGIQDSFNLAWKLAHVVRGEAGDALLDTYARERHALRALLHRDQTASMRRLMRPTRAQALATTHLAPHLFRFGRYTDLPRRDVNQLTLEYRDSTLSRDALGRDALGRGGVRAGDRAPDAEVVDRATGRLTPLFDLLYAGGWTLLAFDGGTRPPAAALRAVRRFAAAHPEVRAHVVATAVPGPGGVQDVPVLLDLDGVAHRAYGVRRPAVHLVRPDGHVALRAALEDPRALEAYWAAIPMRRGAADPAAVGGSTAA